jgi:DNA polymerase bacteriophage-type
MPVLVWNVETKSVVDLKKVGAWKYATHPTTGVWCVGYAVDDGPAQIWTPGQPIPEPFIEAAHNPDWLLVAHNAQFERAIEEHVLAPRYGWPRVPLERQRCTMASPLSLALPGALEKAAAALGLEQQKDKAGAAHMRKMAKPRKPRAGEDRPGIYWHDNPEDLQRLYRYCQQDVVTERALYPRVGFICPQEQDLWQLDAVINRRGFYTDGVLLEAASGVATVADEAVQDELAQITDGALISTNQEKALKLWLGEHGCKVKDIQKPTLQHALRRKGLDPVVRRVVELRLAAAHAAAAKIDALRAWRDGDGRVRGTLKYHGAGTGRWSGHGPQPQNFKREGEDADAKIAAVMAGGTGLASPLEAVGDIARAMICAAPGHRLLIGDFSGIESRVLAWASGQQSKLELWTRFDRTGDPNDDPYVVIGRALGHAESAARAAGKIADLAFGFQGGVGAYRNFAPEDDDADEAKIKQYRDGWRQQHPKTVRFWTALDRAATNAIRRPGTSFSVGRFSYCLEAPFLRARLPSGRSISYPFAEIVPELDRFGHTRATFLDTANNKWAPCNHGHGAYGGIWCENAISGIARDLLAAAMQRLEAAGYPVVLHVHDEIVAEVPDGFGSLEEFRRLITALPDWAEGLPVAAKVREGMRFSKPDKPESAEPSSNRDDDPIVEILGELDDAQAPAEPDDPGDEPDCESGVEAFNDSVGDLWPEPTPSELDHGDGHHGDDHHGDGRDGDAEPPDGDGTEPSAGMPPAPAEEPADAREAIPEACADQGSEERDQRAAGNGAGAGTGTAAFTINGVKALATPSTVARPPKPNGGGQPLITSNFAHAVGFQRVSGYFPRDLVIR